MMFAEVMRSDRTDSEFIQDLKDELNVCRNELCLKCGSYKQAHKGACDGCRWSNEDRLD